ncbi:MAG: hypothetical protein IKY78_05040 [Clostridia bacterium]|nr:hypothetical protein [Clostridia bacterium]
MKTTIEPHYKAQTSISIANARICWVRTKPDNSVKKTNIATKFFQLLYRLIYVYANTKYERKSFNHACCCHTNLS